MIVRVLSYMRRNAIAFIALSIALGGTAYAGTKISSKQIEKDAVKGRQIAANAVGSSELRSDAVGADEIGSGAVGSSELGNGSVGSNQLGAGSVGSAQIADAGVGSADIAPDSVGGRELAGLGTAMASGRKTLNVDESVSSDTKSISLIQSPNASIKVGASCSWLNGSITTTTRLVIDAAEVGTAIYVEGTGPGTSQQAVGKTITTTANQTFAQVFFSVGPNVPQQEARTFSVITPSGETMFGTLHALTYTAGSDCTFSALAFG